jgi:periplasmic protein TonB
MFDDFCPSSTARESHARFRRSLVAAVVLYGGTSAAIVGATATIHRVVEEKETQVTFAPPPPPEPPPPVPPAPAPPKASPRPKARRADLAPPDKVSDEKLKESDKPLAPAGPSGPVDGFLDGVAGGTGTGTAPAPAPPPPPVTKPDPIVPPVDSGRNEKPRYPAAARRKGVEGTVVFAFDVLEDGSVANPQILGGPAELADCVLRAVLSWRFVAAHRGSEKVRFHLKRSIAFRLEDD